MRLDGRRLTASRGLMSELCLQWFETPWSHGEGATAGYRVLDQGGLLWSDADLDDAGVHVLRVVGVSHRVQAMQSEAFDPGEPVILMPEPDNPHDPWALGVQDVRLALHVGYVPAVRSRELVEEMRLRPIHALVFSEHRVGGRRAGLRVAASFAPILESLAT